MKFDNTVILSDIQSCYCFCQSNCYFVFMFGNEKFILAPGESIGASSEVGDRISATVTFTDI